MRMPSELDRRRVQDARDRLLARIYRYRQDQEVSLLTTDEDSSLLYAYSECLRTRLSCGYCTYSSCLVLVTGQLSKEISEILADIGQLFGLLSEDVLQMA